MFMVLVVIAVIVQTIINMTKEAFPVLKEHKGIIFFLCSFLGILCCIAFDGDVFAAYGLESKIPYLSQVLSGICAGGGSSIIYDVVKGIKGSNEELEESPVKAEEETPETFIEEDEG